MDLFPERVSNMTVKTQNSLAFAVSTVLFFAAIFFQTSNITDISIKTATPLIVLSLLTAFAQVHSFKASAVAGFITGAFFDSVASNCFCFNTIAFLLVGVLVNAAANNLFNKNLLSAGVLALLASGSYWVCYWAVFHIIGRNMTDVITYLLKYAFPSAIYTAVFVFPFYFIYKALDLTKN